MPSEPRSDQQSEESRARPLWLQIACGLLMGAAALVILMVLLSRLG